MDTKNLSVATVRDYRAFAFPSKFCDPNHAEFLSFERSEIWISSGGLSLHTIWLEYSENEPDQCEKLKSANIEDVLASASLLDLADYKSFLLTPLFSASPFFSLDNAEAWIHPTAFQAWVSWFQSPRVRDGSPFSRPSTAMSSRSAMSSTSSRSRASSRSSRDSGSLPPFPAASDSDYIVISSDEDDMPAPSAILEGIKKRRMSSPSDIDSGTRGRGRDRRPVVKRELSSDVEILDVSRTAAVTHDKVNGKRPEKKVKHEPVKQEPAHQTLPTTVATSLSSKGIKITTKLSVDSITTLDKIPSTWPVPRDNCAYLIDLSGADVSRTNKSGTPMSLDAIIRAEDQDSWGGSTGHSNGDAYVAGIVDGRDNVHCRRAHLKCNGVDACENIDGNLYKGLERYEADEEGMVEAWNRELDANEFEAGSVPAILARFYRRVIGPCRMAGCSGEAEVKTLRKVSKLGKHHFVGCSNWKKGEQYDHRYFSIPANVDEDRFITLLQNGGQMSEEVTVNAKCTFTLHPRIGLESCQFTHIRDGKIENCKMSRRKCKTNMIIFVPVASENIRKALVVVRHPHNHPMHPRTKPSHSETVTMRKAISTTGSIGLTARTLLNAKTTSQVFDGSVAAASPAFVDRRKVRGLIQDEKRKDYPKDLGWEGLFYEHMERESKLPEAERYIHTVTTKGDIKLAVTMHPVLARLIHSVKELQIDFTFKRVADGANEWEVAGFSDRYNRRYTLASLYCNRSTRDAFYLLFYEFSDAVRRVTGKGLCFETLIADGNLRCVIMDSEAAQAQGLGDFLLGHNTSLTSQVHSRDPLILVQHVLKVCSVHYERGIDKLPNEVPKAEIDRLKGFMGLKSQEAIDIWHQACRDTQLESVRSQFLSRSYWYAHKIAHPWLLPGVNRFLSLMSNDNWDLTSCNSNLVESAHAGRNAETGTGIPLLEAILLSKKRDEEKVAEIAVMEQSGVLAKRWNGPLQREKLSAQRQTWTLQKKTIRNKQLESYDDLAVERKDGVDRRKESLARSKVIDSDLQRIRTETPFDKDNILRLQKESESEMNLRREIISRQKEIDSEIQGLKDAGLAGGKLNGRREPVRDIVVPVPAGQVSASGEDIETRHDASPPRTSPPCPQDPPLASIGTPFSSGMEAHVPGVTISDKPSSSNELTMYSERPLDNFEGLLPPMPLFTLEGLWADFSNAIPASTLQAAANVPDAHLDDSSYNITSDSLGFNSDWDSSWDFVMAPGAFDDSPMTVAPQAGFISHIYTNGSSSPRLPAPSRSTSPFQPGGPEILDAELASVWDTLWEPVAVVEAYDQMTTVPEPRFLSHSISTASPSSLPPAPVPSSLPTPPTHLSDHRSSESGCLKDPAPSTTKNTKRLRTEVDEQYVLPEGSRRAKRKTARASGVDGITGADLANI